MAQHYSNEEPRKQTSGALPKKRSSSDLILLDEANHTGVEVEVINITTECTVPSSLSKIAPLLEGQSRSHDTRKRQKLSLCAKNLDRNPVLLMKENSSSEWKRVKEPDIQYVLDRFPIELIPNVLPKELRKSLLCRLLNDCDEKKWPKGTWNINGSTHDLSREYKVYHLTEGEKATGSKFSDFKNAEVAEDQCKEVFEASRIIASVVNATLRKKCTGLECDWQPTYVLINKYLNEREHIGLHTDLLTRIGPRPIIVGYSLGAVRRFDLLSNDRSKPSLQLFLPHNSMLMMYKDCQEAYKHSVPKLSGVGSSKTNHLARHRISGSCRFSLTFRMERKELPSFPNCFCGCPAALKSNKNQYVFCCSPVNRQESCRFWKLCPWADRLATELTQQGL